MKQQTLIFVLVAIIAAGVGFFGGMQYQQNAQQSAFGYPQMMGQNRTGNNRPNGMMNGTRSGMRPVNGEIIAVDATSITVKNADGSSRIVILSEKTAINNEVAASRDDLKVGTKISAFGSDNSDGSMTALSVQLNPIGRRIETSTTPTPTK